MEQRQLLARKGGASAPKAKSRLMAAMAAAALMLSAACGSPGEASKYWTLGEGWNYADTLVYEVDSAATADIAVVVRHAANYEYSNLWLELTVETPDDEDAVVDTFNVVLADDFGRWRGHGLGVGFQYADTLVQSLALKDSARISLRHVMRADTLPGIEQIGILLINSD